MQALLCIDMQNDFCLEDAPLRVNGAMDCLPYCQRAVAHARKQGLPLIWVVREHDAQGARSGTSLQCGRDSVSEGISHARHCRKDVRVQI